VPRAIYLLGAGTFVLGTTEFVIAGLLPDLARDLAVSLPRAGLLISAFAVAMAVGAPLLTVLTLRLPRRATLLGSLGLFTAGQVLGALAPNYLTLLLARVVTAAATGAFWAVAAVLTVGMVEPGRRARALSVLLGGLTVANVLGVPLGTLVGQLFGWRATFWLIGAAAVVAGLALRVALPGDGRAGEAPAGLRAELAVFAAPGLWLALATVAVYETGVIGTFSYLAPVVTDVARLPAGMVAVVLTLFGVGSLVGIRIGGRFTDGHPWATLFGSLAAVIVALGVLAAWSTHGWVVPVAVLALGVAVFVVGPPLNARVFQLAGPAPTLAGAATTSAFNVGNTAGPWLGGVVLDAGWGPRAPALVGAVVVALAMVVALASWRGDRTVRPADTAVPEGCTR
jgi:DHA1 family chloramphenicol resistance protein-like MFS transporter